MEDVTALDTLASKVRTSQQLRKPPRARGDRHAGGAAVMALHGVPWRGPRT